MKLWDLLRMIRGFFTVIDQLEKKLFNSLDPDYIEKVYLYGNYDVLSITHEVDGNIIKIEKW